jgi:ATP-dependent DNA helicase RecG
MKPSLQKIQKILKLEADQGYSNRAVIGGLDRLLGTWEPEARLDGVPEELIQVVGSRLRDYPRLSETSRAETLEGLWRRLHSESGTQPPALPPAPRSGQSAPVHVTPPHPAAAPASAASSEDTAALTAQPEPAPERQADSRASAPAPSGEPAALSAPVTVLQHVGPRHAQTLARLGIQSLRDMLYYFPRRYDDYSQLKPINRLWYGEEVTVIGTIENVTTRPIRSGQSKVVEAIVSDGTGKLRVTWYNPWEAKRLHNGLQVCLSGRVDQYLGRLVMSNPEVEPLEQVQLSTNRIVPVYPLTAQITQRWLRKLMNQVVTYWAPRVPDYLPASVRSAAGLMDLSTALVQVHFPDSPGELKAARHRLAFDEIFLLQMGVLGQKHSWQAQTGRVFEIDDEWLETHVQSLPFSLTGAQQRAVADVRADLASGRPMNRLLQGDVGSGKTVVAALAIAMVTRQGAQAAVMAPTSILAEQHYKSMQRLLANTNIEGPALQPEQIRLMIGATPEAEKREIQVGLANGAIKLVIGTHALIEDPVEFADLQLAIIDEQHRFGVEQRAVLRSKGSNPHLLVMTATPIPRSLALTVYGDLELSVMDEMPPGRQPVSTHVLMPLERERAYRLVERQVEAGRQAFIIYPLVEESEKSESKAAVEEQSRLQREVFPHLRLGLLHGRLRPEEKDDVMNRFHGGELNILVSTSVVEVGVDVPNATVMLIEGANRFGLAQLHQFRGRVGRGDQQSYCLLIPETSDAIENERLQAMAETNDGFVLAEKDLEQRGPGDFLGSRQSGYGDLQMAKLTDVHLIEEVRRLASTLFEKDPDLKVAEHQLLGSAVQRFWHVGKGDIS